MLITHAYNPDEILFTLTNPEDGTALTGVTGTMTLYDRYTDEVLTAEASITEEGEGVYSYTMPLNLPPDTWVIGIAEFDDAGKPGYARVPIYITDKLVG